MHKPTISSMSAALMVVGLAACTSVGLVGYPAEFVATRSPSHVWVSRAGNATMVDMYNPKLNGDTLSGFDKDGGFVEMPIGDVQLMRAPMSSPGKTALLAATAAIGTALIITHIQGGVDYCANFAPGSANNGLVQPCNTTNGKPTN